MSLEIGKTCQSLHDTCLAKAKEEGLKKLPFKYKIGIVGTDDRVYITKPATPEVQAGILQRLNWDSTKALLQAPYSPL